ncbi:hypothetical protein PybrP1_000748 [[Pythium] brassicae (nom. inval.)]|nr:hypothetical protein PybrP1_000748 [[Pythium] brassicae (nom. inval.)]
MKSYYSIELENPASRYFNARCGQDETSEEYMLRLNAYARRAGILFDAGMLGVEDDVSQYLATVQEERLLRQFFGVPDVASLRQRMQKMRVLERNVAKKGITRTVARDEFTRPKVFSQPDVSYSGANFSGSSWDGQKRPVVAGNAWFGGNRPAGANPQAWSRGNRPAGANMRNMQHARAAGRVSVPHPAPRPAPPRVAAYADQGARAAVAGAANDGELEIAGSLAEANVSLNSQFDVADFGCEPEVACDNLDGFVLAGRQSGYDRAQPGHPQGLPPVRRKCDRGRHLETDCFMTRQCELCKGYEHNQERCLFVCKTCMLVHPVGECAYRTTFEALSPWVLKTTKAEDLPADLCAALKQLNH